MTRINVGVDPSELPDKLLLAEHREITRIPNAIKSGRADLSKPIPEKFTLGAGHVRFFYNKLAYLYLRYGELYKECIRRRFNVTRKADSFVDAYIAFRKLYKYYSPTPEDRQLIVERIHSKGFRLLSEKEQDHATK